MSQTRLDGQRLVLVLYAVVVAMSAVAGWLIATFVPNLRPPAYLFVFPLPPTKAGLAAFGALTVATGLGVPLLLVALASRLDDSAGESPD